MALIVVDMQTGFQCHQETVEAVVDQIQRAHARGEMIFNVMLKGEGELMAPVKRALRRAEHVTVYKYDMSGGCELHAAMEKARVEDPSDDGMDRAIFCGIFEEQCVLHTALDLATLEPETYVGIRTCACEVWCADEYDYSFMQLPENMEVEFG